MRVYNARCGAYECFDISLVLSLYIHTYLQIHIRIYYICIRVCTRLHDNAIVIR